VLVYSIQSDVQLQPREKERGRQRDREIERQRDRERVRHRGESCKRGVYRRVKSEKEV